MFPQVYVPPSHVIGRCMCHVISSHVMSYVMVYVPPGLCFPKSYHRSLHVSCYIKSCHVMAYVMVYVPPGLCSPKSYHRSLHVSCYIKSYHVICHVMIRHMTWHDTWHGKWHDMWQDMSNDCYDMTWHNYDTTYDLTWGNIDLGEHKHAPDTSKGPEATLDNKALSLQQGVKKITSPERTCQRTHNSLSLSPFTEVFVSLILTEKVVSEDCDFCKNERAGFSLPLNWVARKSVCVPMNTAHTLTFNGKT